MAVRKGLFVVPVEHSLQSSDIAAEVKISAQKVIDRIRAIFHISEKSLSFEIAQYSNSSKTVSTVLQSVTGNQQDGDEIRVVFSNQVVPDETIRRFLGKNRLIVVAEEVHHSTQIRSLGSATGCRVSLSTSVAVRFIEDVFLDIFVGRWMVENPVFSDFLKQQGGLPALFRQKARFFRANADDGYVGSISRDAGYAPLSALNKCADRDFDGRAKAVIESWRRFQSTLSGVSVSSIKTVAQLSGQSIAKGTSLESVPGFGKQLPIARIRRNASRLPDGAYTLLVLRRGSSVRKNPKIREKVKALFGENARINSFHFLAEIEFSIHRDVIRELIERQFIAGLRVLVSGDQVALYPNTDGERQ